MESNSLRMTTAFGSLIKNNTAIFSLVESDSHYLIAMDLPNIPFLSTEIITKKNELIVEGKNIKSEMRQELLKLQQQGNHIKSIYKDGVIWIYLPKIQTSIPDLNLSYTSAN